MSDFENKVKGLYWQNIKECDKNCLHDILVEFIDKPTDKQIEKLFFLLEFDDICDAMKFGMSDTEVRESIYSYVKNNWRKK